jgi:hypothetical protein
MRRCALGDVHACSGKARVLDTSSGKNSILASHKLCLQGLGEVGGLLGLREQKLYDVLISS